MHRERERDAKTREGQHQAPDLVALFAQESEYRPISTPTSIYRRVKAPKTMRRAFSKHPAQTFRTFRIVIYAKHNVAHGESATWFRSAERNFPSPWTWKINAHFSISRPIICHTPVGKVIRARVFISPAPLRQDEPISVETSRKVRHVLTATKRYNRCDFCRFYLNARTPHVASSERKF